MSRGSIGVIATLLAAAAPAETAPTAAGRFEVGSYGRVGVGSDLRGQLGRPVNVVAHGPRLIEDSYAELELRREDDWSAVKSRVVLSLSFFPPLFHLSGDPAQRLAIRNLYAEASAGPTFSAWAGSRTLRGDDSYLLDLWPLDDLNTVGGGGALGLADGTRLLFHAGLQRLDRPWQRQTVTGGDPLGYGTVEIARLDRPRFIESAGLERPLTGGDLGLRLRLHAEAHQLGAGVFRDPDTGDETALPSDWGALAGGQLSLATPGKRFAHLWLRHAIGLAAYDELEVPAALANDHTTRGARSTRLAASAGWDGSRWGWLLGAYVDVVRDAGVSPVSRHKYDEGAVVSRAQWQPVASFGIAAEASYQRRVVSLVDPRTGTLRAGSVTQLGLMPFFSPLGGGLFARPQLRLLYVIAFRDAGARAFYGADDAFARRAVEHYFGLSVEWWFNSTTYPAR